MKPEQTPVFFLREEEVLAAFRGLTRAVQDVYGAHSAIAYAVKVNPVPAVCSTLIGAGAWAEVASWREADLVLGLGLPADRVIFNGPFKPEWALRRALSAGIRVHLENPGQLESAVRLAREMGPFAVGLRLKPLGYEHLTRFGFALAEFDDAVQHLLAAGVRVTGLHIHYNGTVTRTPADLWRLRARTLVEAAGRLSAHRETIEFVDFGGGLPEPATGAPSESDYEAAAREYLETLKEPFARIASVAGSQPLLVIEPGRFLVQNAGTLFTRVVDARRQGDGWLVTLDAGICSLPSLDSWLGQVQIVTSDQLPVGALTLTGPSCMEEDVLLTLPHHAIPRTGDTIAFHRVGAYHIPGGTEFAENRPSLEWIRAEGGPNQR